MTRKYGRQQGLQRYQCRACHGFFQSIRKGIKDQKVLWQSYVFKRQTITDLAYSVNLCERQVRRKLRHVPVPAQGYISKTDPVVLVMDTTYFDTYGVMVFRCWNRKRNLLWYFVNEETNADYLHGIRALEEQGYSIVAVVIDGKRWLALAISVRYPVQHCIFHMMKTVMRYLTRHPILQAGKELRDIVMTLPRTRKDSFENALQMWHRRWKTFLKETTTDPFTGHWYYTHRRIRGAYRAVRLALPYLFTWEQFPTLNIPKTTNTLDGSFSQLKQKVFVHRGLNIATQKKMIETILSQAKKKKRST